MKDEEKKAEGPTWAHNQELSFKNIRNQLELAKEGVQEVINEYKDEVARLTAIRNRFMKP